MNQNGVKELAEQQRQAEAKAKELKTRILNLQRNCQHKWQPARYTPDYQEAYTIPGDEPGTMGVDWQGPCYVPAKTTPKWTRYCPLCDKTEVTTRTKEIVTHEPIF